MGTSSSQLNQSALQPSISVIETLPNLVELAPKIERLVRALYVALRERDVLAVHCLLAPDLEWWFHGPPASQHLMRLITGAVDDDADIAQSFEFFPTNIQCVNSSTVLAEGSDPSGGPLYWVHAWTVSLSDASPHGMILTQVREYFNTSLLVTLLCPPSTASDSPASSPESVASSSSGGPSCSLCRPVWQSSPPPTVKPMPGLVLAI